MSRRRAIQFSLRFVVVVILFLSVVLALHVRQRKLARSQAKAVAALMDLGGKLSYENRAPFASQLISKHFGTHYANRAVGIQFGQEQRGRVWSVSPENRLFDEDVSKLLDLPNLRDVSLITNNTTTDCLHVLSKLQDLESLRFGVSGGWSIRGDGSSLHSLSRITSLKKLWLENTPFPEDGTAFLCQLRQLDALAIVNVRLNDISFLNQLPQLKSLSLEACQITDEDLGPVSELSHLRTLNLRKNGITDDGLRALTFSHLDSIDLWFTNITEEGIAEFSQKHPTCTIDWEP